MCRAAACVVQTEEEKAVKVGFGRLLGMNRGEWPYLAVGTLASAAVGTVMPLFAIILSDLINGLTDVTTPPSEILRYAFFFWGLGIGNFICMTIQARPPSPLYLLSPLMSLSHSPLQSGVRSMSFESVPGMPCPTLPATQHTVMLLRASLPALWRCRVTNPARLQGGMFGLVGSNLSERVRRLFFHAVLYMEVAWFDRDVNTSGNLTSRLAADAPTVRGAVGDALGIVVQNVVTLVTGYVIAFVSGWKMTLVITAVLPLLGFSSYMQIKFFTGAPPLHCMHAMHSRLVPALCGSLRHTAIQPGKHTHAPLPGSGTGWRGDPRHPPPSVAVRNREWAPSPAPRRITPLHMSSAR